MSTVRDEVRGIHAQRVTRWFEAHVSGVTPPLRFELIPGGHSNLTYRVEDARGGLYVLRRPPLGAVIATAHDMAREHRIIAALGPTAVPVPPALGLCEDLDVNDAPFYVMRFVEGFVLMDAVDVDKHIPRADRRSVGESVVDVLADLHGIEPESIGLGDLGRREAYLERQLRRWRTQWEKTKTRDLPMMEQVHEDLCAAMPEQVGSAIVHGDYRLGNMITGRDARIAAVLDWELCTLGDPLADIGYLLNNWADEGEVGPASRGMSRAPTYAGGFQLRSELLERYAQRTGRSVEHVDYYRAFQYWRLAAIGEGVLARYLKGVMGDGGDPDGFRTQVEVLASAARELLEQSS